jgi:hypothetical protein
MTETRRDGERSQRRTIVVVGAVSVAFLAACGSSSSDSSSGSTAPPQVTFTEVYAKVLRPCTNCHAGFIGQFDGLDMSTQATAYTNLVRVSASRCSGTLVVPKSAASSVLYQKITRPSCGSLMPQNAPPLSATDVDLVKNWIDEGALND